MQAITFKQTMTYPKKEFSVAIPDFSLKGTGIKFPSISMLNIYKNVIYHFVKVLTSPVE